MSEELREFYYHQPYSDDQRRNTSGGGQYSSTYNTGGDSSSVHAHYLQMFDPSYVSFAEFLHGSADHNSLNSALGGFAAVVQEQEKRPPPPPAVAEAAGGETPATPNSSISSSSTEVAAAAAAEEDSNKGSTGKKATTAEDGEGTSKKESKTKIIKKGEKKEKQQKVAFMTKSEVDHLEDGYRWRKYGQKAVKNSPYPSYYRCTTQKCPVKKRVERSFQDPSIVITTYEGQHNHHLPASLRGNMAGMSFAAAGSSSMFAQPPFSMQDQISFPQEILLSQNNMPPQHHQHHHNLYSYDGGRSTRNSYDQQQQQQLFQQFTDDYGLLQDVIPPLFPKQEH
ncbi:hypothetical protein ABFS83_08G130200 [Erythranthe nasuta]